MKSIIWSFSVDLSVMCFLFDFLKSKISLHISFTKEKLGFSYQTSCYISYIWYYISRYFVIYVTDKQYKRNLTGAWIQIYVQADETFIVITYTKIWRKKYGYLLCICMYTSGLLYIKIIKNCCTDIKVNLKTKIIISYVLYSIKF